MNATNTIPSINEPAPQKPFRRIFILLIAVLLAWVSYAVYQDYKNGYGEVFIREMDMSIYFKGSLPNGQVVGYMHNYAVCGSTEADEKGAVYIATTIEQLHHPYFRLLRISDRQYGEYYIKPYMDGTTEAFRPISKAEAIQKGIIDQEKKFISNGGGGSTALPSRYCKFDVVGIWKSSKHQLKNFYYRIKYAITD